MDKTQQLMVFAIDDKLRTITMPNNGSVFGVSGDIEVNQVEFQMPRYCAGFDMTDFTGRVNYVNPNGDSNYYEAEISGTDDAVSFIWLMKPDVTRYSGDVKFSVKLYKKQDGKLLKQFNTRSAVGRVLEGFDVVDSITPEEQETLLHKIEAEIKEDIKAYIDQYAEDKVSEMTQGLPEAVNSLKEDLDDSNILYNNILQIKNTINMLNPNKLKTGKVIGSNGEVIDGLSTRSTSELINVNPSIKLRVTTELYQSLAQYDSTGNKLAYTDTFNSLNPIDLNEDTKYIRICVWNDTLPFMLYQSDKILSYTDYGKYSENVRELVYIYASDTEEEIYLKLYDACNKGNCDVYWEYGVYEFSTIFELIKTKYGKVTAYELPIGGNCRYFFNGSTIIGTGISSDSNVINNSSIFGLWRKAQSYELHDGIFIANHLIYCVHEEASSSPIPYRTKYHNLRMFHNTVTDDYDTTIGLRKCIGAGTGLHPNVEVSNCYFQTDHGEDIGWHGHKSDDKTTSYINIHNCYFSHGIATDNLSTNETAELIFNGNSTPIIPITNHNGVKGWKVFAWNNEKRSN